MFPVTTKKRNYTKNFLFVRIKQHTISLVQGTVHQTKKCLLNNGLVCTTLHIIDSKNLTKITDNYTITTQQLLYANNLTQSSTNKWQSTSQSQDPNLQTFTNYYHLDSGRFNVSWYLFNYYFNPFLWRNLPQKIS